MKASPKVIESGITPKVDYDAEILRKAREISDLISNKLATFLLDLTQLQHDCIERLNEWTPTERLLTLKEAAVYLGYESRTLDSWTAPNRPPLVKFTKLGGEKRFKKAWLDEAVARGAVKPKVVRL